MIFLLFLLVIDPRYHHHAEVLAQLDSLARQHPGLTRLDTIGVSTRDSLPIPALMISDHAACDEDEPAVLFIGGHHAEEVLGVEICLYLAQDLLKRYGLDSAITDWIDNREIWIIPDLNAEGHEVVINDLDTTWRKNKRDNNRNGVFDIEDDGVDLNRNYDFYWFLGGARDSSYEYYRGPGPFSENETRAVRDLVQRRPFILAVSYHSARTGLGQVVYYPWHHAGGYAPDIPFIRLVADSLAKSIPRDDGNGTYFALIGEGLEGNARNWLYGTAGIFAFDIEVSTTCQPPGAKVDSICIRNLGGAYYLLKKASSCIITGLVTDSRTGQPLAAEIILNGFYDPLLTPRGSDPHFGRFRRIVNPGTYSLTIQRTGYRSKTITSVSAAHGAETKLDIALEPMVFTTPAENIEPIRIFPNPQNGQLLIRLNPAADIQKLSLYNRAGQLLFSIERPKLETVLPLTDQQRRRMANGVYFAVAQTPGGKITRKIVLFHP